MVDYTGLVELVLPQLLAYAPKLLLAVATLFIGLRVIRILRGRLGSVLVRQDVDKTLVPFIVSLTNMGLKILLVITVASMIGFEMTSFIAVLGAAGLAVGLSLQGSLQNFAGGVLILLFKPFKVGDVIETQGFIGKVTQIQIFNTILKTADNKTIILPNGAVSNDSLVNYSTEKKRRVDLVFGIDYGDDTEKAKKILDGIVEKDERILKDPGPFIRVLELADSSVNIGVRVWTKTGDYWDVYYDTQEAVKAAFDKQGISFPFPQMDVHMKGE